MLIRNNITLLKHDSASVSLNCIHGLIVQLGSHPLHEAVIFRRQKMLQTLLHYRHELRLDVNITDMVRFDLIMYDTRMFVSMQS